MGRYRALVVVAMALGGLTGGPTTASAETLQEAVAASKLHTRVFYLGEGMTAREAMTLLRSEGDVRHAAAISDRRVVVIADTADVVGKCETLLRERDAVLRIASPHEPLELGGPDDPMVTRVFRVAGNNMQAVVVILRSIYSVRQLSALEGDNTVSVHATQPVLDSSAALLRELELLALPTERR